MTAEEWIEAFSRAAGAAPPSEEEVDKLLKLASVAAHSSERKAAPLACWVAGGVELDLDRAIEIAEDIGGSDGGDG